jgi:hypothetical protein
LNTAVENEEKFENELRKGPSRRAFGKLLGDLKVKGAEHGVEEGYEYTKGRLRVIRADFQAYAAKCQAKTLIQQGLLEKCASSRRG